MLFRRKIPLSIQFEAACAAVSVHDRRKVAKILRGYGYPFWVLSHDKHLKNYLSFTPTELLDYFKQHPDVCQKLVLDSSDKRFSPSTFIQQEGDKYIVGYVDDSYAPMTREILYFYTIEEAVTDYVLFSLGMPRLR